MQYTTAQEMERLDEVAVENGLEIRQMMELAGFHMTQLCKHLMYGYTTSFVIAVGKGNKGGDGIAAARHLVNHGWRHVSIVCSSSEIKDDANHHLRLCRDMNVPIILWEDDEEYARTVLLSADVIIDSLIGYHLDGRPRGIIASMIRTIQSSSADIIAYDIPSGVDATTGECLSPCITADVTLTLALPKKVFVTDEGSKHSGHVYIGDIGIPSWMYEQVTQSNRARPHFDGKSIIELS